MTLHKSITLTALLLLSSAAAGAQDKASLPSDYVIGVEDKLGVVFWREQDKALTTDVVVPTKLSAEERKAVEELSRATTDSPRDHLGG